MVGFAVGVRKQNSHNMDVLRRVGGAERGRIILESDAPYFPPMEGPLQGAIMGNSGYLAEVVRVVAQIRAGDD